jgi:hypothetical protein
MLANRQMNKTRQDGVMVIVLHNILYSLSSVVPCGLFWMEEQIVQHDHTHFQILVVIEVVEVVEVVKVVE